jgi:uncharacterized protein (TIGR03118 family)
MWQWPWLCARWAGYAAVGLLVACGGGSSSPAKTAASLTLSITPTTISLGQTATISWSGSVGTTCVAGGDWSGDHPSSGTENVTPTVAGTLTYSMVCSGGAYLASPSRTATLTISQVAYSQTNLVSNGTVTAAVTDAQLINPWGLALSPTGPMWIANAGSQTSTLYDGTGIKQSLEVVIPPASGGPANPTGLVYNASADFVVSNGTSSAAALFIFAGEGGALSGWTPTVNNLNAIIAYDDGAGGAVYKGLAIASNGSANFLYATDFHNNKVDVFDKNFAKVTTSGGFADATLPAGYAPFGIQALTIGTKTVIVVTYAQQDAAKHDNVNGAGLGLIDVFDTSGTLQTHLVAVGGALNAPWGIALAPAGFGGLSNMLLIGNFGDGVINAYDPATGAFAGSVNDGGGKPLANPGLWGLEFGNGADNQPAATLYFAAGIFAESGGLYGRIDVGAAAPDAVAPTVALSNAAGTVSGIVALAATASDNVGVASVKFYAGTTLVGTATSAPFTVQWDTTLVANGVVSLTAVAADAAGNTTISSAVSVTVSNAAPAPTTLAQLQSSIFTPQCSSCHDGSGATLPGSMNLSSESSSYAALVNVASTLEPSLKRVQPGDPANSYLVQSLEGTQTVGNRMPDGGPYLDQTTINTVQSWIQAGAGP